MPVPILLFRVAGALVALDAGRVRETLRPQPVLALSDLPAGVLGTAIVRGTTVPVVDVAPLFAEAAAASRPRWITVLPSPERMVAVVADEVVGVMDAQRLGRADLPPLFSGVSASAALEALGRLDGELVALLALARLVPEELWGRVAQPEVAP